MSFPPRAAVPLSPPRWMRAGRMSSQLAGESESFIDSTWPGEERPPCFIQVMFMWQRNNGGRFQFITKSAFKPARRSLWKSAPPLWAGGYNRILLAFSSLLRGHTHLNVSIVSGPLFSGKKQLEMGNTNASEAPATCGLFVRRYLPQTSTDHDGRHSR